jgi:hypothetical protein
MGELSPLTFSVNIDRYVVNSSIQLFLLFKDLCVVKSVLFSDCLSFFSCGLIIPCPLVVLSAFILYAEFLVESSVVVAWWSYIVLVSVYCGRFLLLHQF